MTASGEDDAEDDAEVIWVALEWATALDVEAADAIGRIKERLGDLHSLNGRYLTINCCFLGIS